jgi:hypothetical protein
VRSGVAPVGGLDPRRRGDDRVLRGHLITWTRFEKKIFERTTMLQYSVFQFFAITVLVSMPVKLLIRQVFRIKYVMVTPWFNI